MAALLQKCTGTAARRTMCHSVAQTAGTGLLQCANCRHTDAERGCILSAAAAVGQCQPSGYSMVFRDFSEKIADATAGCYCSKAAWWTFGEEAAIIGAIF